MYCVGSRLPILLGDFRFLASPSHSRGPTLSHRPNFTVMEGSVTTDGACVPGPVSLGQARTTQKVQIQINPSCLCITAALCALRLGAEINNWTAWSPSLAPL